MGRRRACQTFSMVWPTPERVGRRTRRGPQVCRCRLQGDTAFDEWGLGAGGPVHRFDGSPGRLDGSFRRFEEWGVRFDGCAHRFDGSTCRFDGSFRRFEEWPARLDGWAARVVGRAPRFDGWLVRLDGQPPRLDEGPARLDEGPARLDECAPRSEWWPRFARWGRSSSRRAPSSKAWAGLSSEGLGSSVAPLAWLPRGPRSSRGAWRSPDAGPRWFLRRSHRSSRRGGASRR
jgi:hypothetical protein